MRPARPASRSPTASSGRAPLLPTIAVALSLSAVTAAAQQPPTVAAPAADVADDEARQKVLGERAAALAEEISRLRGQMIEAARRAQSHESALDAMERTLTALEEEETAKSVSLARRRHELSALTDALFRLARRPPEALLAQPMPPVEAIRSAILLKSTLPRVNAAARALAEELSTLAALRRDIEAQRAAASAETEALERERQRLDTLIQQKAALKRETETESERLARRVAALAASAKSLRELMDRLGAGPPADAGEEAPQPRTGVMPLPMAKPPAAAELASVPTGPASAPAPLPSISRARGQLMMPARGTVVHRYGSRNQVGVTTRGTSLRTRPGAQVVAPFDAIVVFAGEFRGYGRILILDHGEGYHSLLAGLGRIISEPGQWLLAGEPVGEMADESELPTELYFELRHDGRAIDPLPWVASANSKVSG